ncbi:hypothetical protein BpHYR1_054505 [Brachionus plicatilis]|uniref:Uncharacterized protein n=1 Tax=Brachionus plicatilis TaxID=10195 RepID=A0A3M7R379_BRAPC|nr:hypothetical protein BpHYR1_054505 [Brachionus plicatilis]
MIEFNRFVSNQSLINYSRENMYYLTVHEFFKRQNNNQMLKMISDYHTIIENNDPVRIDRIKKALYKKKQFLMNFGYEKFNIPFSKFYTIEEDFKDDLIRSVDFEKICIKTLNDCDSFYTTNSTSRSSKKAKTTKNRIEYLLFII